MMELVDFQGLNCYQNALITVAAYLGIDYTRAFVNLWPETDFEYDGLHNVYLTKRMIQNLEALGLTQEILCPVSPGEAREMLSSLRYGEPFLACMDTFYIPWSPGCGTVHDLHCFAALLERPGTLLCFDPTYNTQYATGGDFASCFTRLYRINKTAEKPIFIEPCRDEILRAHPQMRHDMTGRLAECAGGHRKDALLLAKYVDTMINNRYLYKRYLDAAELSPAAHRHFFGKDFFSRWNAVKHGLYKACVVKRGDGVIREVTEMLKGLIDDELALAADG